MSLIFRLAGRRSVSALIPSCSGTNLGFIRPITMKSVPYVHKESRDTHDERNLKIGRVMSPHLLIYAPQMTSMCSISHRITGMIVAGYSGLLGLAAVCLSHDISYYIDALNGYGFLPIFLLKFILSFPMTYHFCNGIRHLVWDTARLLVIPEIYSSAYVVIGTALFSAIALSAM